MPARRYLVQNVARAEIGPDKRQRTGQSIHSRSLTLKISEERIGRFFHVTQDLFLFSGGLWETRAEVNLVARVNDAVDDSVPHSQSRFKSTLRRVRCLRPAI